jgi:hypothetical protein
MRRLEEIENPYYSPAHGDRPDNPRYIAALRDVNESPIAMLLERGTINMAQAEAGFLFRAAYEALHGGYSSELKEAVDGGISEQWSERQERGSRKLREAHSRLTALEYTVVHSVAAERQSIRRTAKLISRSRPKTTGLLIAGLENLCSLWGMS